MSTHPPIPRRVRCEQVSNCTGAFDQDAEDNRAVLRRNGTLDIPVLAVGGAMSTSGPLVEQMMREVAQNVTGARIPRTAHWIPEENPEAFTSAVLEFTGSPDRG